MVGRMLATALAATLLALAAPLAANPQVFRSRADLVVLHVNVFDGKSDAVPDLPQNVFQVHEEGKAQEIAFFSSADVPVAAGLLIDNSGSMISRQPLVVAGGLAFAASSHPEDELFVLQFNEHVRYGLHSGVPFTNDPHVLRAGLARYPAGGKTALHDAVLEGLNHLTRATHQKHVLVLLSDGEDNASRYSEEEMLDRARRSDAIIYTVSNADRRTGQAGDPGLLRDLADATGGVAYFPRSDDDVIESFNTIARNIRRGYSIGYVPTDPAREGTFRNVKVTVRVPGRGKLTVRSRHGYTTDRAEGTR